MIVIPGNTGSADFRIDVSEKDINLDFYLYYSSDPVSKAGYSETAYLTDSGSDKDPRKKKLFRIDANKPAKVILPIIK
jgi:hypothetical protein